MDMRLLHTRNGALANERDRNRVGARAVARDAARRVEGIEQGQADICRLIR